SRPTQWGREYLERDDFSSNRHPALAYWWSMIFSENRYPLFGIMLYPSVGSSTILPVDCPDSTSRCASAARANARTRSICARILPSAAAAKHFGTSGG